MYSNEHYGHLGRPSIPSVAQPLKKAESKEKNVQKGLDNNGNIEGFAPRVTRMRARLQHLEAQIEHLKMEGEVEEELRLILGRLETFAAKVHDGLQQADFQT